MAEKYNKALIKIQKGPFIVQKVTSPHMNSVILPFPLLFYLSQGSPNLLTCGPHVFT
jgi:hypothetical protein